jgi:hypothetical protein
LFLLRTKESQLRTCNPMKRENAVSKKKWFRLSCTQCDSLDYLSISVIAVMRTVDET